MKKHIVTSIRMLLVLTLLAGVIYPLVMTAFAQLFFPHHANGSIVEHDGRVIGSELIAQQFRSDRYFWPRPSAINYDPLPSGASNYGPTSDTLRTLVADRKRDFIEKNNLPSETTVPTEMLFASGSGLDPHISPEAASLQIDRIAHARGYDERRKAALVQLVLDHIEGPQFGLFGEPRVNVLTVNMKLDELQ
jgi:K+-transporting ATPase ATPase C chain